MSSRRCSSESSPGRMISSVDGPGASAPGPERSPGSSWPTTVAAASTPPRAGLPPWSGSWVRSGFGSRVGARSPRRPRRRASQSPAPSEANSRRRAKPIRGAERSQFPAPTEANPAPSRRRANPGVQEGRCFVRECPPRGPGPAPSEPIAGAERSQSPAPSEANRRRRAKPIAGAERTRACAFGSPWRVSVRDGAGMSDLEPPATGLPKGTRYHRKSEPRRSPNPPRGANSLPACGDLGPQTDPRPRSESASSLPLRPAPRTTRPRSATSTTGRWSRSAPSSRNGPGRRSSAPRSRAARPRAVSFSRRRLSSGPLPPCGGGLGWGVQSRGHPEGPPTLPSPTRGEGKKSRPVENETALPPSRPHCHRPRGRGRDRPGGQVAGPRPPSGGSRRPDRLSGSRGLTSARPASPRRRRREGPTVPHPSGPQ